MRPVSSHEILFFFQAEDGIRDGHVTGVQTCALPICNGGHPDSHRKQNPLNARPRDRPAGESLNPRVPTTPLDRKSTRLNSSHVAISYAVFCLKKKTKIKKTLIFLHHPHAASSHPSSLMQRYPHPPLA